jgi:Mediator of RNA polymerase II transcription subunit 1
MDLVSRLEIFWLQQLQQGISPSLVLYSSSKALEEDLSTEIQPAKKENIMKKCLFNSLLYKSLNCKPSFQTIMAALEIIANELCLTLFKPDEESSSITICGDVFVIDMHFESDGDISSVKLSAAEVNEIPEKAHGYLTNLAKNLDLKKFEKELSMFAFLDKTNSHHPQFNLFNCLLGLQKDFSKIYELECHLNSPESVLLLGHGQPLLYKRNFGASITYHASQSIDEDEEKNTYYANISIQQSTFLNSFLPKSIQQSCIEGLVVSPFEKQFYVESAIDILGAQVSILVPTPDSILSVNAAFVMELEPTVSISLEMAKAIIGASGLQVTGQNLSNWTGPTFEEEYVNA